MSSILYGDCFFNLTLSQALVFTCLQYKSFENTVEKGEIARNKQFLLFPQSFLPIWIPFCHFHQILNSRLQSLSVWKSLKFVIWERVECHPQFVSIWTSRKFCRLVMGLKKAKKRFKMDLLVIG